MHYFIEKSVVTRTNPNLPFSHFFHLIKNNINLFYRLTIIAFINIFYIYNL